MSIRLAKLYCEFYQVADGLWFLAVEDKFGLHAAVELDTKVWERGGEIEAKRIRETFHIEGDGVGGVSKALEFSPWAGVLLESKLVLVEKDRAVLEVARCPPQVARVRDGRGEFPCKPVDLAFFSAFARTIDSRVRVKCLCAPPDSHPQEYYCRWEFYLE